MQQPKVQPQKFFELIPPDTRLNFVGLLRPAVALSALAVLLSLALLFVPGPDFGIDFAGGSLIPVRFAKAKQAEEVRKAIESSAVELQDLGGKNTEFLIRTAVVGEEPSAEMGQSVVEALAKAFPDDAPELLRKEAVGPRVSHDLRRKSVLAVFLATLMIGVYIWMRFDWRFAVGTAVALLHDVIIVVGLLIVFGYEFDLIIVAGLLTVVGFSVNDKVVVSGRIRENRRKDKRSPLATIINTSINETLSRTVLTNGTTFFAALAVYLFGGSVLRGFGFALVVGSLVGTYSSICIASTIVLLFERSAVQPVGRAARAKAAVRSD
jgi:preprotein translocase subunit SecF